MGPDGDPEYDKDLIPVSYIYRFFLSKSIRTLLVTLLKVSQSVKQTTNQRQW